MTVDLHPALTQPVMAVIHERHYFHCAVIKDGVRALPQLTGINGDHPLQRVRKLIRNTPGSFVCHEFEQLEQLASNEGATNVPTAVYTPRKGWSYTTINKTSR